VWNDKWSILEGFWNSVTIFVSPNKRRTIKTRREVCSVCVHCDKKGERDNAFIKGKPACGICGCNIKILTACLSCECSLNDIGEEPKWK